MPPTNMTTIVNQRASVLSPSPHHNGRAWRVQNNYCRTTRDGRAFARRAAGKYRISAHRLGGSEERSAALRALRALKRLRIRCALCA